MLRTLDARFADASAAVVLARSTEARRKAAMVDADVDTEPVEVGDAEVQITEVREAEVQTEEATDSLALEDLDFATWSPGDGERRAFLAAGARIVAQLARNAQSHAFDDLAPPPEDDVVEDALCLFELACAFSQPTGDVDDSALAARSRRPDPKPTTTSTPPALALPVTGLSWNSLGTRLFASFGRVDRSGWDTTRAGVVVWSPFDRRFDPASPDLVLETPSSALCVACHPREPSIVAAGTASGEIFVWDTNRASHTSKRGGVGGAASSPTSSTAASLSDPLLGSSRVDDLFHSDSVQAVRWVFATESQSYFLVSTGVDGRVLIWSLANNLRFPLAGFRVAPSGAAAATVRRRLPASSVSTAASASSGSSSSASSSAPSLAALPSVGATALAFRAEASQAGALPGSSAGVSFIVGSEVGDVFGGRMRWANLVPSRFVGASDSSASSTSATPLAAVDRGRHAARLLASSFGAELAWSEEAAQWVVRAPDADRRAVIQHVERSVRASGTGSSTSSSSSSSAATVGLLELFAAQPRAEQLFPPLSDEAFSYHPGVTLSVDASPFHRDVFLTAGSDGFLRIWTARRRTPLLSLAVGVATASATAFSAAWSRVRPLVVACGLSDGSVYVFDLVRDTVLPTLVLGANGAVFAGDDRVAAAAVAAARPDTLKAAVDGMTAAASLALRRAGLADGTSAIAEGGGSAVTNPMALGAHGLSVLSVAFNPKQRRLVAAGDASGRVRVWKLPARLARSDPAEEVLLRRFEAQPDEAAVATGASESDGQAGRAGERAHDEDDEDDIGRGERRGGARKRGGRRRAGGDEDED